MYTAKALCANFNCLIWKEHLQDNKNDPAFVEKFRAFIPYYKCLNNYLQSENTNKPIPFKYSKDRTYLCRGVCDLVNECLECLKDSQKRETGFYCDSYLSTSLDYKVRKKKLFFSIYLSFVIWFLVTQ